MNKLFSLLPIIFLASCAYLIDTPVQELTIETPGAQGAICYAEINKTRYNFNAPQTRTISNSREDMIIDCYAPGNRQRRVVIEANLTDSSTLNVLNGGAGYVVDGLSEALYKYPDTVYVDFTSMATKPESLPAHNNTDIPHPDTQDLEEFRAKELRLRSDRDVVDTPIQRRQAAEPLFRAAPVTRTAPPPAPMLEK